MGKYKNAYFNAKKFWQQRKYFGCKWAFINSFLALTQPIPKFLRNNSFFRKLGKILDDIRKNYITTNYSYIFEKYENYEQPNNPLPDDAPIFVFWAQGEQNMPPVVKVCYESIKRHRAKHPVVFLDTTNIDQYVEIPKDFKDKVQKGNFAIQHLADVIRNKLLSERGGIWCDATIYLTETPKQFIHFDGSYFYLKGDGFYRKGSNWNDHFMIGTKGNAVNTFLADVLSQYHKREEASVAYGLMTIFAIEAYVKITPFKNTLDAVAPNNLNQWYISRQYKETFNPEEFEKAKEDTNIFKTFWAMKPVDDPNSLYQQFISGKL